MPRIDYLKNLDEFRHELGKNGVNLPADVERVASGFIGVCFISKNEVLKLFVAAQQVDRNLPERSTKKLKFLTNVSAQIMQRGIAVPQLIEYGEFPEPVAIAGNKFFAWQRMTRIAGKELQPIKFWKSSALVFADRKIRRIADVAAKLHIQVGADSKNIATNFLFGFSWQKDTKLDTRTHNLLLELGQDIDRWSTSNTSPVMLHGDFHSQNIMHDTKAGYGVIDWDFMEFGRPERDLYKMFGLRPKQIKEFVRRYNNQADHPADTRLVTAYALADCAFHYFHFLQLKGHKIHPLVLANVRQTTKELAEEMHKLTGKKIYADYAREFSKKGILVRRPPNRRTPRNQPAVKPH